MAVEPDVLPPSLPRHHVKSADRDNLDLDGIGDLLPVLGPKLTDEFGQIEILLGIPISFGILRLLSQCIILIRIDVVGFLGCHIQVSLLLLLLQHFLHVVIALRKRLLFVDTLLASDIFGIVGRLGRSLGAALRLKILGRPNLASGVFQI